LRFLGINIALLCVTSLPVWLLRGPAPTDAVVHWVFDDELLDPRFEILVDGGKLAVAGAETEQRLRPGRHTLVVMHDGRQRQRREFRLNAGDRLIFRIFVEE
jgi:hypothetical protein